MSSSVPELRIAAPCLGRPLSSCKRRIKSGARFRCLLILLGLYQLSPSLAGTSEIEGSHIERREDAWWTGPMLAPAAETLSRGHILIERYIFEEWSPGRDKQGTLDYVLYGLTDYFSVGAIATGGSVNKTNARSAGFEVGDLTMVGELRLNHFTEQQPIPTISLVLEHTFPTAAYDKLGPNSAGALGSGSHATAVGVYAQTYVWLANGHILRPRLDLLETFSQRTHVTGASVYATPDGFSGYATPGNSFNADAAIEYSLNKRWVLALDVVYHQTENTSVLGSSSLSASNALLNYNGTIGESRGFSYAPALEFNFSAAIGVLIGVRLTPASKNVLATYAPVAAINWIL